MANNYQLDVQDTTSVEEWKKQVVALNEKTEQTVREAGTALAEFHDTAEGTAFENWCNFSDQVIQGTTSVLGAMTELVNSVTNLVNTVKSAGVSLVESVAGVVKSVFS